ncbi:MAG TPA: LysR family transcriptional regulator, partial [Burkholderiaceae bacterium]|nr:LysR family transcriptional regulator [Burkholderiaceae bacterium]
MNRIDDLQAFVAIVDHGSQTAAARHLQRTLQSISRSLATLEHSVGVPLIRRTTRRSQPTEAGLAFHARIKSALAEIDEARSEAADRARQLSGRLVVAAPVLFARSFVTPVVCDFLARFPAVEVDLRASDEPADLMGADLDVAIRVRQLPDSTLKVRRLGELRRVTVASRDYLRRHGGPREPAELARHACIVRAVDGHDDPWVYSIGGEPRTVAVTGRLRTNDMPAVIEAVVRGLGIGLAPWWQVRELIE